MVNKTEDKDIVSTRQAVQEIRKGARLYEVFKFAEDVITKLETAEEETKLVEKELASKQKELEACKEFVLQEQKNHESALEKRNIQLQGITAEAEAVRKAAAEFRDHERAKAATYIANANAHVESLKDSIEAYKKEQDEWKNRVTLEQRNYEDIMKKVENLRSMLK